MGSASVAGTWNWRPFCYCKRTVTTAVEQDAALQHTLRRWHTRHSLVRFDGHSQGPGGRLEDRFKDVMRIPAVVQDHVKVERPGIRDRPPELLAEFRAEVAENDVRHVRLPDETRPATQVHRGGDERLIQRQRTVPVAANAVLVGERVLESLS